MLGAHITAVILCCSFSITFGAVSFYYARHALMFEHFWRGKIFNVNKPQHKLDGYATIVKILKILCHFEGQSLMSSFKTNDMSI